MSALGGELLETGVYTGFKPGGARFFRYKKMWKLEQKKECRRRNFFNLKDS